MPLQIGYWSIRGLGAPVRMIPAYAGIGERPALQQRPTFFSALD